MGIHEHDDELTWSIGEGWKPLVRDLLAKLLELDPTIQILQVKEKFGGLRVYYVSNRDTYDAADELVAEAEALAARTCENCGKPGHTRTDRAYVITLCDECAV